MFGIVFSASSMSASTFVKSAATSSGVMVGASDDRYKYAEAGIPHYWCIEDEDGAPVVHVYELDEPTGAYAPAGIFRDTLQRPVPFEVSLDLDKLTPPRSS